MTNMEIRYIDSPDQIDIWDNNNIVTIKLSNLTEPFNRNNVDTTPTLPITIVITCYINTAQAMRNMLNEVVSSLE